LWRRLGWAVYRSYKAEGEVGGRGRERREREKRENREVRRWNVGKGEAEGSKRDLVGCVAEKEKEGATGFSRREIWESLWCCRRS
jgi:hypothetical protein